MTDNHQVSDLYLSTLQASFDRESSKYKNKISNEDLIKFRNLEFDSRKYFGRTDIFSQEAIDNCYKSKFFSVLITTLIEIYHQSTLEGKSVAVRFEEIEEYILNLITNASQCKTKTATYLELTNSGIHTYRDTQDLVYSYWGANLDQKLLLDAKVIVKIIPSKVDLYLSNVDKQNNLSNNSSDCFVVTATFGTPYAQEVIKYRHFRDRYLSQHPLGLFFIEKYSFWGPKLAVIVRKNSILKLSIANILGTVSQFLPEVKDDLK